MRTAMGVSVLLHAGLALLIAWAPRETFRLSRPAAQTAALAEDTSRTPMLVLSLESGNRLADVPESTTMPTIPDPSAVSTIMPITQPPMSPMVSLTSPMVSLTSPMAVPSDFASAPEVPREANPLQPAAFSDDSPGSSSSDSSSTGSPARGSHASGLRGPAGVRALHRPSVAGQKIVYLLDRSASMGRNQRLRGAIGCIAASLEQLHPRSSFQIVAYDHQVTTWPSDAAGDWGYPEDTTKVRAILWCESLRAEGSTNHVVGLKRALWLQPDAIFWLTDADDLTPSQVAEITQLNRGRTAIHTILIGAAPSASSMLRTLALANGGSWQAITWRGSR